MGINQRPFGKIINDEKGLLKRLFTGFALGILSSLILIFLATIIIFFKIY